jgi:hypothetical protein
MTTMTDGPGIAIVGTGNIATSNAKALRLGFAVYRVGDSLRPVEPRTMTGAASLEGWPG